MDIVASVSQMDELHACTPKSGGSFTWLVITGSNGMPIMSFRQGIFDAPPVGLAMQGLVSSVYAAALGAGVQLLGSTSMPLDDISNAGTSSASPIQASDKTDNDTPSINTILRHALVWRQFAQNRTLNDSAARGETCTMALFTDALQQTKDAGATSSRVHPDTEASIASSHACLAFLLSLLQSWLGPADWWNLVANPNLKTIKARLAGLAPAVEAVLARRPVAAMGPWRAPQCLDMRGTFSSANVRQLPLDAFVHEAAKEAWATHAVLACGACIVSCTPGWHDAFNPESIAALLVLTSTLPCVADTRVCLLSTHLLEVKGATASSVRAHSVQFHVASLPIALRAVQSGKQGDDGEAQGREGVQVCIGTLSSPLKLVLLRPSRMRGLDIEAGGTMQHQSNVGTQWSAQTATAAVSAAARRISLYGLAGHLLTALARAEACARLAHKVDELSVYNFTSGSDSSATQLAAVVTSVLATSGSMFVWANTGTGIAENAEEKAEEAAGRIVLCRALIERSALKDGRRQAALPKVKLQVACLDDLPPITFPHSNLNASPGLGLDKGCLRTLIGHMMEVGWLALSRDPTMEEGEWVDSNITIQALPAFSGLDSRIYGEILQSNEFQAALGNTRTFGVSVLCTLHCVEVKAWLDARALQAALQSLQACTDLQIDADEVMRMAELQERMEAAAEAEAEREGMRLSMEAIAAPKEPRHGTSTSAARLGSPVRAGMNLTSPTHTYTRASASIVLHAEQGGSPALSVKGNGRSPGYFSPPRLPRTGMPSIRGPAPRLAPLSAQVPQPRKRVPPSAPITAATKL